MSFTEVSQELRSTWQALQEAEEMLKRMPKEWRYASRLVGHVTLLALNATAVGAFDQLFHEAIAFAKLIRGERAPDNYYLSDSLLLPFKRDTYLADLPRPCLASTEIATLLRSVDQKRRELRKLSIGNYLLVMCLVANSNKERRNIEHEIIELMISDVSVVALVMTSAEAIFLAALRLIHEERNLNYSLSEELMRESPSATRSQPMARLENPNEPMQVEPVVPRTMLAGIPLVAQEILQPNVQVPVPPPSSVPETKSIHEPHGISETPQLNVQELVPSPSVETQSVPREAKRILPYWQSWDKAPEDFYQVPLNGNSLDELSMTVDTDAKKPKARRLQRSHDEEQTRLQKHRRGKWSLFFRTKNERDKGLARLKSYRARVRRELKHAQTVPNGPQSTS